MSAQKGWSWLAKVEVVLRLTIQLLELTLDLVRATKII